MKERPILFSGPMVRALLAGTKTQTRRVLNPQSSGHLGMVNVCPYGQPNDRLWGREGFCTCYNGQEAYQIIYSADRTRKDFSHSTNASEDQLDWLEHSMTVHGERGRPGIHMPRWACRLELEVSSVRVERLQDISEDDAKAEGCDPKIQHKDGRSVEDGFQYRIGYALLWNAINGSGHWEANPWVWVVEFRRCTSTRTTADAD